MRIGPRKAVASHEGRGPREGVLAGPGPHCRTDRIPVGGSGSATDHTCSPASLPATPTAGSGSEAVPAARPRSVLRCGTSRGMETLRRTPVRCAGRIIRPGGKLIPSTNGNDGRDGEPPTYPSISNAAARLTRDCAGLPASCIKKSTHGCIHRTKYRVFGSKQLAAYVHFRWG